MMLQRALGSGGVQGNRKDIVRPDANGNREAPRWYLKQAKRRARPVNEFPGIDY